jgi:hypothetical protein
VFRAAVVEIEREWEAGMGREDWRALERLLVRLNANIGAEGPSTQVRRAPVRSCEAPAR